MFSLVDKTDRSECTKLAISLDRLIKIPQACVLRVSAGAQMEETEVGAVGGGVGFKRAVRHAVRSRVLCVDGLVSPSSISCSIPCRYNMYIICSVVLATHPRP